MPLTVLSIQSHVVAGHVGNDAACFTLQRLGIEVWPIHTVQFSNHLGYGAWTGQTLTAEHVRSLIDGLDAHGFLGRIDAVLSGYIGTAATGSAIADAAARVKAQNAKAIFCCDPVMGDTGPGLFVQPDVPPFFSNVALPLADIVTPNVFELSLLTGKTPRVLPDVIAAARQLLQRGPRIVLVTSVRLGAAERIDTVAVTADQAWLVSTPFVALEPMPNGMGDCIAALFLGRYLKQGDVALALSQSVSSLYALVNGTDASMPRDLNLIAQQESLINPSQSFSATLL